MLALAKRGFVDRSETDLRYTLGPAGIAVGDAARVTGSVFTAVAPLAEELARASGTCVALTSRDGAETRVERVFDHAPAFAIRTRPGESAPLVPPFGSAFVAWDPPSAIEQWLDAAPSPLDHTERGRYRAALWAVRDRGYSVGVANTRPINRILASLVDEPHSESLLRERDAVMRELSHSEFLPVALDTEALRRVNHMSAPVFDAAGCVAIAIMVLGPTFDLTPAEIGTLGERLLATAREATARIGGRIPEPAVRTAGVAA